jgi:hypothetical protein
LLCDIAKHRVQNGLPTILLIGGQFNLDEPWSQIVRLLGLTCSKEELIGALEAAGQTRNAKVLIVIDALNEGQGKTLWKNHLAGLLLLISRSPWLSVAISIRTSYEALVIPPGLVPARLIREIHPGFADHEYRATQNFFDYYSIERPSVPLLLPEFQNPLFLKIFCQALNNNALTRIPAGLQGITAIFKFFIDSVNLKLSDVNYLDFNPRHGLVWRALEFFAAKLAADGTDWLPAEIEEDIINAVLPRDSYDKSLYRAMVSEGLIAENRFYNNNIKQYQDGVHFAYEKFTDHLIAQRLSELHIDITNPAKSFEVNQPLHKYVKDSNSCARYQGLIEALSIQIPERVGKELVELVPAIANFDSVIEAFVDSLIWRNPKNIYESTIEYINSHVLPNEYANSRFLNALLTVASNPIHPYNADFLHNNLKRLTLAERDATWSIFLHEQYKSHDAVDRLLEWSW